MLKINQNSIKRGAVYDLVEPNIEVCKPAGQWNHFLLTIDHGINKGSVKLNGTQILEFPLSGENGNH